MLNSKSFSERLEKILGFYGLSASALAEEIDFNRSTISHLVSGRNKPSLEFVMKLLQKFPELDMDWLVLGKGTFPAETVSKTAESSLKQNIRPTPEKSPNLFSETIQGSDNNLKIKSDTKEIERIAVFFTDGTFKVYEN